MEINADIGERMGDDEGIMARISMGNVACGGHASDAGHMADTVRLAAQNGVKVCAHPGYEDVENFGRVSVSLSRSEIVELVNGQVGLLKRICEEEGVELCAIKPHGALYHDMMQGGLVRDVMVEAAREFGVPLVVQASVGGDVVDWEVEVLKEVFADRGYCADGGLMARTKVGSLHEDVGVIVEQTRRLMKCGEVFCGDGSGEVIVLEADTICFHGDNAASVEALKCLYAEG